MITGFNTDVDYNGRVFHVQTEDKGRQNPVIESLVYSRGEIVASRLSPYLESIESDCFSQDDVMERMERQHQALIRDILNGKFEADGPRPFGHNIISNRSLDEVVCAFLAEGPTPEPICLERVSEALLIAGTSATLKLRVVHEKDERPAGGAQVRGTFVCGHADPVALFSTPTDAEGYAEVTFEIPDASPDAAAAIHCEARSCGARVEQQHPVATLAESV